MNTRRRLLPALLVLCALLASAAVAGWQPGKLASVSSSLPGESTVEAWILIGIISGFGVLTIRMLRYRHEEKSILRRLRRNWSEKRRFWSDASPNRRPIPRNQEREARA